MPAHLHEWLEIPYKHLPPQETYVVCLGCGDAHSGKISDLVAMGINPKADTAALRATHKYTINPAAVR